MSKPAQLFSLFTILFLGFFPFSYAQEIDTLEINGEQYFVYPFDVQIDGHAQYERARKTSRLNEELTFEMYQEVMLKETGESMSKKDFKKVKREIKKLQSSYSKNLFNNKENRYLNSRKLLKAIRKNPYPLLQQRFQENSDLTPMLDPIPDGKYVQLYDGFCLIDEKGECQFSDDRVAGYFSMKNNLLEGEATWIDLRGDTLKHGWFVNGIKEGEWKFERRELEYVISPEQVDQYIERGFPDMDTLTEYITYEKGAKHGPYRRYSNSAFPIEEGFFNKGVPSGTWINRDIIFTGFGQYEKRNRNNELITLQFTYESDKNLVAHPLWLRKGIVGLYGSNGDQFNFYSKYSRPELPSQLYEIAYEKEENLELDEELEGAPYDLDFYEEDYYNEMSYNNYYSENAFGYDDYYASSYDKEAEKFIARGLLMDSIGARPKYSGVYEARYENGQLAYKFEFENGLLVKEDTIFWDNGKAHDVITEVPDSNQYLRSIYDYDGKLYMELAYDSLGDFIRIQENFEVEEFFMIDGYRTTGGGYGNYYFYNKYDTLNNEAMVDSTLLFQSWCADDSTKLYSAMYHPEDKRFSIKGYSVVGSEMLWDEKSYGENFESWTGKKIMRLGDIELKTINSGTFFDFYEPDSIPIRHIREDDKFTIASEYVLSKNGQAYTGPVELNFDKKKLKFSKKDLIVSLPNSSSTSKKLKKDLARYRKKGKTKYPIVMNFLDATEMEKDLSSYIFTSFFSDPLGGFFQISGDDYYNEYYEGYDEPRSKKKNTNPVMTKIEGFMLDGKPSGLWTGEDQFGKKMIEVSYLNGEVNGTVIMYDYANPLEENEYSWMDYDYNNPLRDSFPEKRVHYVSNTAEFLNGKAHGKQYSYSWYGGITEESNYEDGFKDGLSIERNKLATTQATYKYGEADGYVRTYLTLNPRDSILLYNLNFQDGLLQGESKAFHTNGKLAKRGFFLDGQPIEDYEAYDSLGFKYHYVKFKYSYPIEEKIWEENELSVRYLFDWQDSIYFQPTDITTSQSLESVISSLGLGGGYFERPYYGRKSLVNKNGINYHMTKYYPNDTISRDGDLNNGRKVGCWKYFDYYGELLYEVDYQDSIIEINDSIRFKSKGVLIDFDSDGIPLHESFVIEMSSKYDCSHTDHYEVRQLYTKWEANDSLGRMNGNVQNFYDNGSLQSEGAMKNGLPDGVWKYYDPYGKLNQYGVYVLGKRNARWLSGDLSKTKYLGDICLNPNLPDLEKEIKYRENLLDIKITNYNMGKSLNTQFYDINMNTFIDAEEEESVEGEED